MTIQTLKRESALRHTHRATPVRSSWYKDRVYNTHLRRRSYREGALVKNETLGNLTHLSDSVIDLIRRSLQRENFVPLGQAFEICSSRAHGHVQAVSLAMERLGLASLLASKHCRERELVLAMLAQRIISPATKLATTRLWQTSTLAADLGALDASDSGLAAAGLKELACIGRAVLICPSPPTRTATVVRKL